MKNTPASNASLRAPVRWMAGRETAERADQITVVHSVYFSFYDKRNQAGAGDFAAIGVVSMRDRIPHEVA